MNSDGLFQVIYSGIGLSPRCLGSLPKLLSSYLLLLSRLLPTSSSRYLNLTGATVF